MFAYSGCHLILFQLTRPLIFFFSLSLICAAKSLHGEVFRRVREECVRTAAHRTALGWVSRRRRQNSYWLRGTLHLIGDTAEGRARITVRGSSFPGKLRRVETEGRARGFWWACAFFPGDFTNRKEWKKTLQRWALRRCTCSRRIPSPDRGSEKIRLPGVFFKRRLQRWGD